MLEIFSQIGELVGGIGAIAALVYLAIQIRQSNALARAQSRQNLLNTFSQTNWEVARNDYVKRVIAAGLQYWPDIPDADKTTFDLTMGRYLSNLQNGLLLRDTGMLDPQTFDGTANYMLMCVITNGGQRWWKDTVFTDPGLRAYIDERLAHPETLPDQFDQSVPHWAALAEREPESG